MPSICCPRLRHQLGLSPPGSLLGQDRRRPRRLALWLLQAECPQVGSCTLEQHRANDLQEGKMMPHILKDWSQLLPTKIDIHITHRIFSSQAEHKHFSVPQSST